MEKWIIKSRRFAGPLALLLGPLMMILIFGYAPNEVEQGPIQKIFYIHVPMAIFTYLSFGLTALASGLFLWTGNHSHDRVARASAEVGVLFCTLVLLTGPIWAKPVWGAWWTWEARLTFTLILWFVYVAYLLLRNLTEGQEAGAKFGAVLGVLGVGMVPFIRIAVDRFRGQHPGNPFKAGLPFEMAFTFYVGLAFFFVLFVYVVATRTEVEYLKDDVRRLRLDE